MFFQMTKASEITIWLQIWLHSRGLSKLGVVEVCSKIIKALEVFQNHNLARAGGWAAGERQEAWTVSRQDMRCVSGMTSVMSAAMASVFLFESESLLLFSYVIKIN